MARRSIAISHNRDGIDEGGLICVILMIIK